MNQPGRTLTQLFAVAALGVTVSACGDGDLDLVVRKPGLSVQHFRDCREAELAIDRHRERMELQERLENAIAKERFGSPMPVGEMRQDAPGASATEGSTGANNQFRGIDESDFAKPYGDFMLSANGRRVEIARVRGAGAPRLESAIELAGTVRSLAVNADGKLAVVHAVPVEQSGSVGGSPGGSVPGSPGSAAAGLAEPSSSLMAPYNVYEERLALYDLKRAASDRKLVEIPLAGHSQLVRIDGERVVAVAIDHGYAYVPKRGLAFLKARLANSELSDETCARVAAATLTRLQEITHLVSIELGSLGVHNQYLLDGSYGQSAHFDGKSLYLVGRGTWRESRDLQHMYTTLYRYDASASGLKLAVTGELGGYPINAYAFSEHEGVLRVALDETMTTRSTRNGRPDDVASSDEIARQQNNVVVTLKSEGGVFSPIGKLRLPALNEHIRSVRFEGPTAYVVTFRQIDPLFVIDLADPASPKLLGELKVPGFSAHLRRVNPTMLLGVGDDGQGQGKLSLFDVADAAKPSEIATLTVEPTLSSLATLSPQALTFDDALERAYVPLDYAWWMYGNRDCDDGGTGLSVLVASWGSGALSRVAEIAGLGPAGGACASERGYYARHESASYVRAHRFAEQMVIANHNGLKLLDAASLSTASTVTLRFPASPDEVDEQPRSKLE